MLPATVYIRRGRQLRARASLIITLRGLTGYDRVDSARGDHDKVMHARTCRLSRAMWRRDGVRARLHIAAGCTTGWTKRFEYSL